MKFEIYYAGINWDSFPAYVDISDGHVYEIFYGNDSFNNIYTKHVCDGNLIKICCM